MEDFDRTYVCLYSIPYLFGSVYLMHDALSLTLRTSPIFLNFLFFILLILLLRQK